MRYLITIIVLITVICGSLFNEYLVEILDIRMLGNTQNGRTNSEEYTKYMNANFTENTNELAYIDPLWNSMLKNILGKVILENGQSTNLAGAIPVNGEADISKAWGPYQGEYSIQFQGYSPNKPDVFEFEMGFKPSTTSQLYRAPVNMQFEGTYKDDYVVMKIHPKNAETGDKVKNSAREEALNKIIGGIEDANNKGNKPSFTDVDIKQFKEFILDPEVAQLFQASLQTYYSSISESCSVFKDKSGIYLSPYEGSKRLDNYGELQWMYDELIDLGYDADSAAKMIFVANISFMIEYQTLLYHSQNAKVSNAWTYYKERSKMDKFGDLINKGFDNIVDSLPWMDSDHDVEIRDAIHEFISEKSKDTISPLMMFTSISVLEREEDGGDSSRVDALYDMICANEEIENINMKNVTLDLGDLYVRDDILASLYITITGDYITKNDITSNQIKDFGFNQEGSDSVKPLEVIKNYRITKDQKLKSYVKSITTGTGMESTNNAFTLFKNQCGSNQWGSYMIDWNSLNGNNQEIKDGIKSIGKHSIGRAFFEYVSAISITDITTTTIDMFTSDGLTYAYMYPYMATGDLLLQILQETQDKISSGQIGVVDFTEVIYGVYSNFDTLHFKNNFNVSRLSGLNVATLNQEQNFLKNKEVNNEIDYIYLGAYHSSNNIGGFNYNDYRKIIDESDYNNSGYVNIYNQIYGNQKFKNLNEFGGPLNIDTQKVLEFYSNLSKDKKNIQIEKAVDYENLLEGINFEEE